MWVSELLCFWNDINLIPPWTVSRVCVVGSEYTGKNNLQNPTPLWWCHSPGETREQGFNQVYSQGVTLEYSERNNLVSLVQLSWSLPAQSHCQLASPVVQSLRLGEGRQEGRREEVGTIQCSGPSHALGSSTAQLAFPALCSIHQQSLGALCFPHSPGQQGCEDVSGVDLAFKGRFSVKKMPPTGNQSKREKWEPSLVGVRRVWGAPFQGVPVCSTVYQGLWGLKSLRSFSRGLASGPEQFLGHFCSRTGRSLWRQVLTGPSLPLWWKAEYAAGCARLVPRPALMSRLGSGSPTPRYSSPLTCKLGVEPQG